MKLFKKKLFKIMVLASAASLIACGNQASSIDTHETVTLNFGGSTSVEKIAKALTQSFDEECKYFNASHNHTGSGDAFKYTQGSEKNSATKLDVGFLSRDLKVKLRRQKLARVASFVKMVSLPLSTLATLKLII